MALLSTPEPSNLAPVETSGAGSEPAPPPAPRTVEESGLELAFIADLILKQVLFTGEFTLADIAGTTTLPLPVVDAAVDMLRREKLVEVKGTARYLKTTYRFGLTDYGRTRGSELMDICRYTGPAPVTLEDYHRRAALQSVRRIAVTWEEVRRAFSGLLVEDGLLARLGPAIGAGKPLFLYGPSGNGKTTIAERIGELLPGTVMVPYALLVGGQIITVFDPVNHRPLPSDGEGDRRWLPVRRPVIKTGGELTLRLLDLEFNPIAKFYEAPLQVKANHGLFIIDDFGRQPIDPQNLLNRWIVSLDRGIDFLSLHTGIKFAVPFDQLVLFATNRHPHTLMDEAFLRRIRNKIRVDRPSEPAFELIFRQTCEATGIPFEPEAFGYLLDHYFRRLGIPPDACHPRDIVEQIIDRAAFLRQPPRMSREALDAACESYFVTD